MYMYTRIKVEKHVCDSGKVQSWRGTKTSSFKNAWLYLAWYICTQGDRVHGLHSRYHQINKPKCYQSLTTAKISRTDRSACYSESSGRNRSRSEGECRYLWLHRESAEKSIRASIIVLTEKALGARHSERCRPYSRAVIQFGNGNLMIQYIIMQWITLVYTIFSYRVTIFG